MTREEAIHELQEDKKLYETEVCHAGDGSPDGRLLEAIDMAIEALSAEDVVPYEDYRKLLYSRYPDELVRCKDCRHANECHKNVQYTRNEQSMITLGYTPIEWCSCGERRKP